MAASGRCTPFDAWQFVRELSDGHARAATRRRIESLAAAAGDGVTHACGGVKIHYGGLSSGCAACVAGHWSCLFVVGRCNAACFFCPEDRRRTAQDPPSAEGLEFPDPAEYVEYLARCGFSGMSFSGGEPLLALDTVLSFLSAIRARFGCDMYVWLYTNGDRLDVPTLRALRDAGLDEIRLDLAACDYDLARVALARRVMACVSVEIPAIPEDVTRVEACLPALDALGVRFVNLHELVATDDNFAALSARPYTLVQSLDHVPAVLESSIASLRLVKHASERGLRMGVHYCSAIYKSRYQPSAARQRAARWNASGTERITEAGYLAERLPDGSTTYSEAELERGPDGRITATCKPVAHVRAAAAGGPDADAFETRGTGVPDVLSTRDLWRARVAAAKRAAAKRQRSS